MKIVKFKDGTFAVRSGITKYEYLDKEWNYFWKNMVFANKHCKVDTREEAEALLARYLIIKPISEDNLKDYGVPI